VILCIRLDHHTLSADKLYVFNVEPVAVDSIYESAAIETCFVERNSIFTESQVFSLHTLTSREAGFDGDTVPVAVDGNEAVVSSLQLDLTREDATGQVYPRRSVKSSGLGRLGILALWR
jgi:hypothetical protein